MLLPCPIFVPLVRADDLAAAWVDGPRHRAQELCQSDLLRRPLADGPGVLMQQGFTPCWIGAVRCVWEPSMRPLLRLVICEIIRAAQALVCRCWPHCNPARAYAMFLWALRDCTNFCCICGLCAGLRAKRRHNAWQSSRQTGHCPVQLAGKLISPMAAASSSKGAPQGRGGGAPAVFLD